MRYLLVALLLGGCTQIAEHRADMALARHGPYCEKLGYQRDTDQWRSCVQTEAAGAVAASQRQQQITNQILRR